MTIIKPLLIFLVAVLVAGCGENPTPTPPSDKPTATPAPVNAPTNTKKFETRGIIRGVPEGGQTLLVRHDEIPGYMPKMTMELNVRDTNEVLNLQMDDEITFRLVATEDTHWIENIRRVGHITSSNAPAPATAQLVRELKPGDDFPDAELLDERGRTIRFSELRGQAVAFSLFFTRCPIPDFCPLMNKNFSEARRRLLADKSTATNWTFISISFDSEFDSPAMLAGYARSYRGNDASHWLFVNTSPTTLASIAPQIDFMYSRDEDGSFSHNLRTVVIDSQGRVQHIFNGNKWQAEELAKEMKRAMQAKP